MESGRCRQTQAVATRAVATRAVATRAVATRAVATHAVAWLLARQGLHFGLEVNAF